MVISDQLLGEPDTGGGAEAFAIVAHRGAGGAVGCGSAAMSGIGRPAASRATLLRLDHPAAKPGGSRRLRASAARRNAIPLSRLEIIAHPAFRCATSAASGRMPHLAGGGQAFHVRGLTTVGGRVVPDYRSAGPPNLPGHGRRGNSTGYVVANPGPGTSSSRSSRRCG